MPREIGEKIDWTEVIKFSILILRELLTLIRVALFRPTHLETYARHFASLYSKMWDYAEHSISNRGFNLPSALGNGPVQTVNRQLANLYNCKYACLSFGGSSGAILILLIAVLPKLQAKRRIVIYDEACHQSTIGGLIFGRWKTLRIPREFSKMHGTTHPIRLSDIRALVETHGAGNIAAVILVLPSYDGFRARSEERQIFEYAKSHGIFVIVDGAWDATAFRKQQNHDGALDKICDVWITSPHKRGLSPSSLGCMATNDERVARLWDEALDLGFRSSSLSFVDVMIAEHRLEQILDQQWNQAFEQADASARELANRLPEVHPDLYVVKPTQVLAESDDPAHILISTSNLPCVDARIWARNLSENFGIDVEKSSQQTVLLLCASPTKTDELDQTLDAMKLALAMSDTPTKDIQHAYS